MADIVTSHTTEFIATKANQASQIDEAELMRNAEDRTREVLGRVLDQLSLVTGVDLKANEGLE